MTQQKRLRFYRATRLTDILDRPKPLRTKIWEVRNVDLGIYLGRVSWFGRWRQYCFDPFSGLTFEKTCLRTIAEFCERNTRRHYANLRKSRRSNHD